jgi:hypothetical protein
MKRLIFYDASPHPQPVIDPVSQPVVYLYLDTAKKTGQRLDGSVLLLSDSSLLISYSAL